MSSTSSTPVTPERSLADWLRLLRDGWPAFVICVGLGLAGAVAYTSRQQERYGATYTLVVSANRAFLDPQNADQLPALADTVGRLAVTTSVLRATARRYAASAITLAEADQRRRLATPRWVDSHVSTLREGSSPILRVSASAGTQRDASDLAQAAGRSLSFVVNQTSAAQQGVPGGLHVTRFPVKPDGKTSPTPSRNLFVGVNAGVLLGLLAAFLLGLLRDRLWRREEIAAELQLPMLASVRRKRKKRVLAGPGFAALPDRLTELRPDDRPMTVLVSGVTSDDCTLAVSRLMVRTLEASGSQSLLLDRDLHTVFEGMPAARRHTSPAEGSTAMGHDETVEGTTSPVDTAVKHAEPASAADFVIILGPTVKSAGPAMTELARQSDYAILVVKLGTSRRALRRVHESLSYERRLVGTIVVE